MLFKQYARLLIDPVEYVEVRPSASSVQEWHFAITGPPETGFESGIYHGKLVFTDEYPAEAPEIYMITPNGKYAVGSEPACICSIGHNPDKWTMSKALSALVSTLYTDVRAVDEQVLSQRRKMAKDSHSFNARDPVFCELFPELVRECPESTVDTKDTVDTKVTVDTKDTAES